MTIRETIHVEECPALRGGPCRCDELDPVEPLPTFTFEHEPGCAGHVEPGFLIGPVLTCQTCDLVVGIEESRAAVPEPPTNRGERPSLRLVPRGDER